MARTKQTARKSTGGKNHRTAVASKRQAQKSHPLLGLSQRSAIKRRNRSKPGAKIMKEIKTQQSKVDLLIPKLVFSRLARQITTNYQDNFRWTKLGLEALQSAAEHYLIGLIEDGNLCALHAKRVTLMKKDLCLAMRIRNLIPKNDPSTSSQ